MYTVELWGDDVAEAIDALPARLLAPFAELRVALELAPWSVGVPFNPDNPGGSRTATFGPADDGLILFGIRERDARVVTVLSVVQL